MILERFFWEGSLSYLIACEKTLSAVLLDPVGDLDEYAAALAKNKLNLLYIIDTHSHADHVSSASMAAAMFKASVLMSNQVEEQRKISKGAGEKFGIEQILKENGEIKIDAFLEDAQQLKLGELNIQVLATPGHTKDSICLLIENFLFTGDTLLIGQCGRTDLPGGSSRDLYQSVLKKILPLSNDCIIYPGHDYKNNINSTLGYEKINNPFLQHKNEQQFIDFVAKFFPPLQVAGGGSLHCGIVNPVEESKEEAASPLMNKMCIAMEYYFRSLPHDWNIIAPEKLKEKIDKKEQLYLLDVREPDEFMQGHLSNAINISVRQIADRVNELPKDREIPIITICRSGARSATATLFLRGYGYSDVKSLDYGMLGWIKKGYPVKGG